MPVAPAALAAFGGHKALCFAHIRHNGAAVCFFDYCAAGNFDFKVGSVFAVLFVSLSGQAVLCCIFSFVSEIRKRCKIVVNDENNVAALAAVAAVRAAGGNIFFTVKRNCARAAVAGFDLNFCYIYKHRFKPFL